MFEKYLFDNTFDYIVDEIDALVYVIDLNTYEILYCNNKCKKEFGNVVGKKCFRALQVNESGPCLDCPSNLEKNRKINNTYKWEHTNSLNKKTYLFSDKIIKNQGRVLKIQVGLDISSQKNLEDEIKKQEAQNLETFEALFNSTMEALIIYNMDKKCVKVNNVAPKLLGYSAQEMIGKTAFDFIAKESLTLVKEVIENIAQEPYEAMMVKKNKEIFPALIRGKNILLNNEIIRVSAIIDITEIKEKEKEISKLAYYDYLTSLPNRLLLEHETISLMNKNIKFSHYCAFIFIDLDHFKNINDTKGHIVGDSILVKCAKRLKSIVKSGDIVSRFGGDEFIVLINTQKKDKTEALKEVELIAKKILTIIKRPFIVDKDQYQLSASIGIYMFNKNVCFNELLKRADSAMYHMKAKGRDNYGFYSPILQDSLERKALLSQKLRKAINCNGIEIQYQKQYNSNKKVIGVEALARWEDVQLGKISPAEFIPIAEENGLIIKFGHYLIEEVAKVLQKWQTDIEKKHWRMSINVSLSQFQRDDFQYIIKEIIEKYKIDASLLRLEITESLLLDNSNKALQKIDYLKNLGLTISIDDFGTGYSSLAYLKKLSIDELKIDKSFIDDILIDESDETIVLAILEIGKKFNFEVIAEGVETEEIYKKLMKLGCNYFQGYYFAKPQKKEEL